MSMNQKNPHAIALGKRGRAKNTPAQKAASAVNGKKGGRPLTFKADCGHLVSKKDFYQHTYHGATACKACAEKIGIGV